MRGHDNTTGVITTYLTYCTRVCVKVRVMYQDVRVYEGKLGVTRYALSAFWPLGHGT